MLMVHIFDYDKFISSLPIKKTDSLLVNSNFLKLMISAKKKGKKFDQNRLIDSFCDFLGNKGTLIIPSFSWEFCKNGFFDKKKTKSITGSFANTALNRKDFKRTLNPVYSFLVYGKDQKYLCSLKHHDSFGLNSPFGYLIKKKAKNLFIDIDYKDSFTFVHVAEQVIGIDYRYKKKFEGTYLYKNNRKKISTIIYSRKIETGVKGTKFSKKFDNILIKNNALIKNKKFGVSVQTIQIDKAFKYMKESLLKKNNLIFPIY
jgi:aminoglycoside 3-N-acetyltransferase